MTAQDWSVPIGDASVTTGEWIEVRAPYDNTLLGRVPACGPEQVDDAVRAASVALEALCGDSSRLLVLGTEELMYLPLRLALELARSGAAVAISDVDTEGLAQTEEQLKAIGAPVRSDRLDVTEREAFQIYADFSGYTDIAIGVAALLGGDLAVDGRAVGR